MAGTARPHMRLLAAGIALLVAAALVWSAGRVAAGSTGAGVGAEAVQDAVLAVRGFDSLRSAGARYALKTAGDGPTAASSAVGTRWQAAVAEAMRAERELSTSDAISTSQKNSWHDAVVRATTAAQQLDAELAAAGRDAVIIEQAIERFDQEVAVTIDAGDTLLAELAAARDTGAARTVSGTWIALLLLAGAVTATAIAGSLAASVSPGRSRLGRPRVPVTDIEVAEPVGSTAAAMATDADPGAHENGPPRASARLEASVEDHLAGVVAALVALMLTSDERLAGAVHLALTEPDRDNHAWLDQRHERWDGGGPGGLAADDIPIRARIVALADAVAQQLVQDPGVDAAAALAPMSGTRLDPRLVVLAEHLEAQGMLDQAISVLGREQPPAGGLPTAAAIRELCLVKDAAQPA